MSHNGWAGEGGNGRGGSPLLECTRGVRELRDRPAAFEPLERRVLLAASISGYVIQANGGGVPR